MHNDGLVDTEESLSNVNEENNLKIKDYLFIFATYIISQVMASIILVPTMMLSKDPNIEGQFGNLLMILLTITQVVGLVIVAFYIKKKGINLFKRKTPLKKFEPLFLAIAAPLFVVVVNGVFSYLMQFSDTGTTANQQILETTVSTAKFLPTLLAIGIIAPIYEELVFRSIIFMKTGQKYIGWVLVATSTVFSFAHSPSDWVSFMLYFSLGFILGYVAYKTNKIEHAIFIHMVNNIFSVMTML